jgi:hypothetical protein
MLMKRTIFVLLTILVVFVALFAVLVLRPLAKVKASKGCSNRTLHGNYGLTARGFDLLYNASFSMLATFDGKGGLTGGGFNIVEYWTPYPTPRRPLTPLLRVVPTPSIRIAPAL